MVAPDTLLGSSIVIASLFLISLWWYERRDTASITDPYILLNAIIALTAGAMTYVGFIDVFQSMMTPITDSLVTHFDIPARWQSSTGMDTVRYTPTDILRVLVVISVFIYASYRDIKERIVRNWVWYPLFVYGLIFLVYDLWTGNVSFLAPWVLGNILFAMVLGYMLFWTKLFGGADMKALWGLGLILPTYPALIIGPRVLPPLLSAPHNAMNLFALTILANTALVALCWPLYTCYQNIRDGGFDISRPGLMFTARRIPLEDTLDKHGKVLPVWAFESSGPFTRVKVLILTVIYGFDTKFLHEYLEWHNQSVDDKNITNPTDIETHYVKRFVDDTTNDWSSNNPDEASEAFSELLERQTVWMTPGIPFIIPMFLGLLLSLTIGDIVYWGVLLLN